MSENYDLNMAMFETLQSEELLVILDNFKNSIDKNGTTYTTGIINYLCMLLCG